MNQLHSKIIGQGEPMIILHGLFGMLDNWQRYGKIWSDRFEVHLVDQRNHGRSFHSERFDYAAMAHDLLLYMDQHQIPRATILGHSMGGKTAMLHACVNPDRINRLIIVDIAPKYYPPHHQEILKALHSVEVKKLEGRADADKVMAEHLPQFGVRQFLLKNLYWKTDKQLDWRFNLKEISENIENVGTALNNGLRFKGPTLFIRGEKSDYVLPQDYGLIHTHFPNAEIRTVEKAGHWVHAENPQEFEATVNGFLA